MANRSKLALNIIYFLLGLLLILLYFLKGHYIIEFLGIAALIVFIPIIVIYLREEGFYGKYSTPSAQKEWKEFQSERETIRGYTQTPPKLAVNLYYIPLLFVVCLFVPAVELSTTFSVFFSLILLVWGLIPLQHKRIIDDTPTLKTNGVFIGQVELKGTAESENPFTSHITETKCVYHSWTINELQGNGWVTVSSGKESSTFYLKDDTGAIRIDPKNAILVPYTSFPVPTHHRNTYARQYKETLIRLHSPLYVIGHARERQDLVLAEIAYDEKNPLYIISTKSEKKVSNEYRNQFSYLAVIGFIVSIIIPLILANSTMRTILDLPPLLTARAVRILQIPGTIFVAALIIGWLLVVYNSLVNLRNVVDEAWSMIDIQLQRRNDLIPNLVEIVEGYKDHEQEIQLQIATLRTQSMSQDNPSEVSSLIQLVAEAYPELGAGQLFLGLQRSLEDTEQRIALARDYYNQLTRFYNTRLEVVPDTYVARLGRLEPKQYWGGASFNRAQGEIDFAS